MPAGWPGVIVEAGFTPAGPGTGVTDLILGDAVNGLLGTGTLGTSTVWTALNGYIGDTPIVQAVTITRTSTRQQGPLTTYEAGTATIVLANSDARFSPENLAGPYVVSGQTQIRPMIPIRVRATWGSSAYTLFTGYVRSWTPPTAQLGPDYDYTVAQATDAFCVLAGVTIPLNGSPAGAGELSGARVNRILAAAGWYASPQGLTDIDAGQSTVQATTFGGTALSLLQLTADSEIADLYVRGDGAVVFRDRNAPFADTRSSVVQAVFGDTAGTVHPAGTELAYVDITRPDDDTTLANDVQATIDGGSNIQHVQDAASVARLIFPRSYERSDLILRTDADALGWAGYVLALSKNDESRFDSLVLQADGWPDDLFPQVLGREIGDRIQVWRDPPGMAAFSRDCFIRSITHTITVDGWTTEWGLQGAGRYTFLVLDDPVLGQLDNSNSLSF
jgi:hypothetical protein